ncbi:MAG TPA: hypothetical protein VFR94_02725 [Nitrososphaeraceae archaeon]|nr:hypothetical protein [Nitrososphaeraceae archaeon]
MARLRNTKIILSILCIPRLIPAILNQVCYRSIAPAIDLTTKSAKTRVDNAISGNVVERFVTLVNHHSSAIIGYVLLQLEGLSRAMRSPYR